MSPTICALRALDASAKRAGIERVLVRIRIAWVDKTLRVGAGVRVSSIFEAGEQMTPLAMPHWNPCVPDPRVEEHVEELVLALKARLDAPV